MKKLTSLTALVPRGSVEEAWREVGASFERFCLTAGLATRASMMEEDAVELERPRIRARNGKEMTLPSSARLDYRLRRKYRAPFIRSGNLP